MDSNETAARIVAGTQDAVIYADRDGAIQLWNAGAERIFGWSADEAAGKSLDIIVPEKSSAVQKRSFRNCRGPSRISAPT